MEQGQTGWPKDTVKVEGDMGDTGPPLADRKSQGPCPVQPSNR